MKKILSIICLATTIIGCNNHKSKIQDLQIENKLLKDTIHSITEENDPYGFDRDSFLIDTSLGDLGGLLRDTLILFARYAECGEWGGHQEFIEIYFEKDVCKCLVIYDSVVCRYKNVGKKLFRTDSSIVVLNKPKQKAVLDYLVNLTMVSFLSQEPPPSRRNFFSASTHSIFEIGKHCSFKVCFYDDSRTWDAFKNLRDQVKSDTKTY